MLISKHSVSLRTVSNELDRNSSVLSSREASQFPSLVGDQHSARGVLPSTEGVPPRFASDFTSETKNGPSDAHRAAGRSHSPLPVVAPQQNFAYGNPGTDLPERMAMTAHGKSVAGLLRRTEERTRPPISDTKDRQTSTPPPSSSSPKTARVVHTTTIAPMLVEAAQIASIELTPTTPDEVVPEIDTSNLHPISPRPRTRPKRAIWPVSARVWTSLVTLGIMMLIWSTWNLEHWAANKDASLLERATQQYSKKESLRQFQRDDTLDSISKPLNAYAQRNVNHFAPGEGARIDPHYTSPSARVRDADLVGGWLSLVHFERSNHPNEALSRWEDVGDCWCAVGKIPQFGVKTSRRIFPKSVIIEHIASSAVESNAAAPREMEVWAQVADPIHRRSLHVQMGGPPPKSPVSTSNYGLDSTFVKIIGFEFLPNTLPEEPGFRGTEFQIPVDLELLGVDVNTFVIKAMSNWGSDQGTCFYRVQMWGKVSQLGR